MNEGYLFELVDAYVSASNAEDKKRILSEISAIEAYQLSFDDWSTVFYEVDDVDLKNLLAEKIFEIDASFDELIGAFNVAVHFGTQQIQQEILCELKKTAESVDVDRWIDVYNFEENEQLKDVAFEIIVDKRPDFDQWLDICQSDVVNDNHMERALQRIYESDGTFREWFDIFRDDHCSKDLKTLARKVVSEKECTFEDLVYAYNESEYYPEHRAIVMDRFLKVEATEEQWLSAYNVESDDELGMLAETKLADSELWGSEINCSIYEKN